MKPITIEQEAAYAKHKIDHREINHKQLHDWEISYLAWQILGDAGKHIGANLNADT